MARDYTNPKHIAQKAAWKLEYHQKKRTPNSVHIVLEHLCQQIDVFQEYNGTDTNEPEDDAKILQNIITHHVELYIDENDDEDPTAISESPDPVEIFVVNTTLDPPHDEVSMGACIDSGEQRTVIGKKKALEY